MSIKKVKPWGKTKSGQYIPINPDKYKGKYPIVWRSSWELKYCKYCDREENILYWSSEPFPIKYYNPLKQKTHNYFPDYWIRVKTTSNEIREFLIEVKPYSQLIKPKEPKRKTVQSIKNYKYAAELYVKHLAKAKAAKLWAENNNMEYKILTEKTIK